MEKATAPTPSREGQREPDDPQGVFTVLLTTPRAPCFANEEPDAQGGTRPSPGPCRCESRAQEPGVPAPRPAVGAELAGRVAEQFTQAPFKLHELLLHPPLLKRKNITLRTSLRPAARAFKPSHRPRSSPRASPPGRERGSVRAQVHHWNTAMSRRPIFSHHSSNGK